MTIWQHRCCAALLHKWGKLYWWHHCFSISHRWFNNKAIFVAQFPWKKCLLAGNKSFGTRFRVLLNVCWQIQTNSDWRNTEGGSVDKGKQHWADDEMWIYMNVMKIYKCYKNTKNNILYLKNGLSQECSWFFCYGGSTSVSCSAKTQMVIKLWRSAALNSAPVQFVLHLFVVKYVTALHDAYVTLV